MFKTTIVFVPRKYGSTKMCIVRLTAAKIGVYVNTMPRKGVSFRSNKKNTYFCVLLKENIYNKKMQKHEKNK